MSKISLSKKTGLKLGVIASLILISFLFSYAQNTQKIDEGGSAPAAESRTPSKAAAPYTINDVKQIQTLLALLKFNPGPIDGIFGQKTKKAIMAFQLSIGVPVTGIIDENLKEQLDGAYKTYIISKQDEPEVKKEASDALEKYKEKPKIFALQDIKLFSEPELKGQLVGEAKSGDGFSVICRRGSWLFVRTNDQRSCWVHESWMAVDSEALDSVEDSGACGSPAGSNITEIKQTEKPQLQKELAMNRPKAIEKAQQQDLGSKNSNLKPDNHYLKFITIGLPVAALIFLAYYYRIWTRIYPKKRQELTTGEEFSQAEKTDGESHEEEIEDLIDTLETEKKITEKEIDKSEPHIQDRNDFQDPSHPRYITPVVRRKVWMRNKGQCAMCGSRKDLQYDYITPISAGGNKVIENLQLLCIKCEKAKFGEMG